MRVQRIGSNMKVKRLRLKAPLLFVATGLYIMALTYMFGEHVTFAQVSPVPSTATGQIGISPDEPVAPPQPLIVTKEPEQNVKGPAPASQPEKTVMPAIPEPDPNNPVAVQTTNLLKLAYSLKSEVDKTTKDTLSVTVVRKAAEIEQMARKMRSK